MDLYSKCLWNVLILLANNIILQEKLMVKSNNVTSFFFCKRYMTSLWYTMHVYYFETKVVCMVRIYVSFKISNSPHRDRVQAQLKIQSVRMADSIIPAMTLSFPCWWVVSGDCLARNDRIIQMVSFWPLISHQCMESDNWKGTRTQPITGRRGSSPCSQVLPYKRTGYRRAACSSKHVSFRSH
jgi:hypothetical protein